MQLTKKSRIVPKRGHKADKYQGAVDPKTKLRHGNGVYHYDNPFFTYQGNYLQGKKNGHGTLKMKDGTIIKATFDDDQMNGASEIYYPHGATYKGNLFQGEKQGQGLFKSEYEEYEGQWKENCKNGQGKYKNLSTDEQYSGQFQKDKFQGKGKLTKWNYSYEGFFSQGMKDGQGIEISDWLKEEGKQGMGKFEYRGGFSHDLFDGEGTYKSRESKYVYKGQFSKGKPSLYPNEFRVFVSINSKNGEQVSEGEKTLVDKNQGLQYEIQGDSFNLYIQTVYQGPQQLDPVQPTPEEIEGMVKNWQNENKKNKNPPPMPDFNQPRMKKPDLILVTQESGRTISLKLIKENEGNEEIMKVDYRSEIIAKRKENEELRQEALKKAEEDGGKKGGKKDNKGEPELKVNIFNSNPSQKDKTLNIYSLQGSTALKQFQLPDDFPPGKYQLQISSPFFDFGMIEPLRKDLTVKIKAAKKK